MDKQRFLDRYFSFWKHFHSGIQVPKNLRDTALSYCQILTRKSVSYGKFDEICSVLEEEQETMSLNFNIVAYVLDYIEVENIQEAKYQESQKYINLPKQRTPLGQIDIKKLEPSIKILNRNCPNLGIRELLERINTLRAQGHGKEDRYCQSCNNTGYVYVGEKVVACCQCNKGTRIYELQGERDRARMATYEECQLKCQRAAQGVPF